MQITSGDLLVAPAMAADYRFARSVVMLTHASAMGSYGLVLNRISELNVQDLVQDHSLRDHPQLDIPIYWGGPVQPNTIWMLHPADWSVEATLEVNDLWSLTSHSEMFEALAEGQGPEWYRIFHGFSGWRAGQLERELEGRPPYSAQHSWLVINEPPAIWLQEQPPETLWLDSVDLSAHQAVDHWLA